MIAWFLITLRKSQSVLRRVQLPGHLRVSLSFLLLDLASCDARAPVPSRDAGNDGDDLSMSRENAAVVDVVGVGKYVDVVGSSTPVRANAGFEYEMVTFREAVSHALVQDSGGVVDTSGLLLYKFLLHLHSASAFIV